MRTYNILYQDDNHLTQLVSEISANPEEGVLVRVHSALHNTDRMNKLLSTISGLLPGAAVIGTSASNVFVDGRIYSDSCLISISFFSNASMYTARCSCKDASGSWRPGKDVADDILSQMKGHKKGGLMIAFLPFGYSAVEAFVNEINSNTEKIIMIGGVSYMEDAEGNISEELAYVLEGTQAATYDCVIAHIESEDLLIYEDYICGAQATSKPGHIDSDGHIIKTVDGIPSGSWYNQILNENELIKHPDLSAFFPLVKQDERAIPYYVDYVPIDPKDSGKGYQLESYGELTPGSQVSVGYFHPEKIFDQLNDLLSNVSSHPAEAIFAYTCATRLLLLQNCANWEIENFSTANISGAMLSGEIVSRNQENYYANYTFVVACVSESPQPHFDLRELDRQKIHELQEDNVHMLNYLLANATTSLSAELRSRQLEMENSVFHNSALNLNNHLKYLYDRERGGIDKLAVFWLDNERILRLFSGISNTYDFLRTAYNKARDLCLVKGMHIYSYEDTSLMIAADESLEDGDFLDVTKHIHEFLNGLVLDETPLSYITVLVSNEDELMVHVEPSINYARNKRADFVLYSDIKNDVQKKESDLKMVWEIREAIIHKRVIPYFQEIHNNYPENNDGKQMFEALMRIADKDGKIFFPDSFLPVAKEFGLYDSLSEAMVSNVFDMFKDKDIRVSLNLSVNDIYNHNIVRLIFSKMQEVPHPENFVIEIIESEEIQDYEFFKSFASRIHEFGGKISIDDFGSGFSNMHHVLQIEADYIKIDGELIKTITTDSKCRDFVQFMAEWCEKNHQELICEYVENREIQDIMEQFHVAYSQGYLFSKPHPWEEV